MGTNGPNGGAELTLKYAGKSFPLSILAAAKIAGMDLKLQIDSTAGKDSQPVLRFPSGDELLGPATILKYLARSGLSAGLYPSDPLTACQADQLLDFVTSQLVPGAGMEGACAALDAYLSHRTLFAGHVLSITDIATWGILQSIPQWNKLRKRYPHLNRWFEYVSTIATLQEVVNAHTSATRDGTKDKVIRIAGGGGTAGVDKKKDVGGSWDIDLPGAEMGKVVTRFPPEPSGYLHIGHAKAALLNQEISDRFKGRMLVRFDDTNPSKERDEYVENIINDIKRLGLRFEQITYTSDYFPQLVECAERLINAGHCYCDDTPVDEMREQRMHGIESVCRNRSVEENLRLWQEMLKGSEEGIRNCLRVKLDMTAANKALRDPVAFRCNPTHHWRTGTKYKCYPTYDFACPMVDSLEGVTHALRTSEYRDREAQFQAILGLQQSVWSGLPSVHIWDYARLSFINTVLSKRKLTWFVENGVVDGWNDPRMPTVQGMLRRGLQLSALREFILHQGASRNVTYHEWDKIWTINKKVIDPVCPRHTAVEVHGRVPVRLTGGPESIEIVEVPRHNKYPPAGTKKQLRSSSLWLDQVDAALLVPGEEITLMGWGNAIIKNVHHAEGDASVVAVDAALHLEGDFKKTKLKLTWLADTPDLVPLELHHFGYLLTKKKLEEEDDFHEFVNKNSRTVYQTLGDVNFREIPSGTVLQLERRGYYIVDIAWDPAHPDKPAVLFNIPDGRAKNM